MASVLTIGGTAITMIEDQFDLTNALDERQRLKCDCIDYTGAMHFSRGAQVVLTDPILGVVYSGYLNTDKETPVYPTGAIIHSIDCVDQHYLADKRTETLTVATPTPAGVLVLRQWNDELKAEGVVANSAFHIDTTNTDFNAGILSNTVGTLNVGDGDLELSPAGTNVTISEATTSDFSTGTLVGVQATSNTLTPTTVSAISVSAQLLVSIGDNSATIQIWSGSQVIGTLDTLHYDIWIASTSPAFNAGIDFTFNDGSTLSGEATVPTDQNNLSANPTTDLSSYAKDTWYSRSIALGSTNNGKTVSSVNIVLQGDSTGTYTIYVKNIYLQSNSGSPFFSTTATATNVNPPVVSLVAGYVATLIYTSVVKVFDPSNAYRISPAHSIDAVKLLRSSQISWQASSTFSMQVSYDGNAYLAATNNAALPGLPAGANIAGLSMYLKEVFTCGSNPTVIPILENVQVSLLTSWNTTKSDIVGTYGNSSQWNTGTLAGTSVNGNGDLTLGTLTRDWNDNTISNQTFFPSSGGPPTQSASTGKYVITVPGVGGGNANFAVSRFEFAGAAQDFVAEWDMVATNNGGSGHIGVVYRTTGWSSFDLNFGYLVEVIPVSNQIQFGYGSNASNATGTGTYTQLALVSQTITSGTSYHFKLVVTGSRHRLYFNNSTSTSFDVTDTHIAGTGNIGFRTLGAITNVQSIGSIDNFTLTPAILGSWQGASTSLSSIGTVGGSIIAWLSELANGAIDSTALVQTSIDGGTTWLSATNGAAIPGLPVGTNVSSVSLLVKIILYSATIVGQPIIQGLVWRVMPTFPTVTGTRSTVPEVIDTLARANVSGSWGTSFDGQSITKNGTGTVNLTSNEGTIANTTGDCNMVYGSRTATDQEATVRFQLSASTVTGMIKLRYTDSTHYYELSASTTTLSIIKQRGSTTTTLGTASVSLSTGTWYRLRFRIVGSGPINFYGRVWADQTLEPTTWGVTGLE